MEYDLARIYEILTNGGNLADAKPGEPVEIKGNLNGFRLPTGGKISYLLQKGTGPELRIVYDDSVIEVGKKYVCLSKVPEIMAPLVEFLENNIIGEFDE